MPVLSLLISMLTWHGSRPCEQYALFLERLTGAYFAKQPLLIGFENDAATALVVRNCFTVQLEQRFGRLIGYKAALTSEAARKRFGVREPILGLLFEKMLLSDGAEVPVAFGASPMCEADLIVRVGNSRINQATTETEALASIDAVIPFLELPDAVYGRGVPLSGPAIVAVNAGARLGVLGASIPVDGSDPWLVRLGRIEAIVLDGTGNVLAKGGTKALLGHPMKAVLWIRDALVSEGKSLKKGDLLSLGSVTPPLPIRSPGRITVRYEGLDPEKSIDIGVVFVK